MISKVVCKAIVSGGILKSVTIARECNNEKNRYIKGENYNTY